MKYDVLGSIIVVLASLTSCVKAQCPMMMDGKTSLPRGHPRVPGVDVSRALREMEAEKDLIEFSRALREIDFEEVEKDLIQLFHDSQERWPADYANYGPFFVRLAWHCSGSYRTSDGRGGCDGGRQRFDPERSWEDNTNLDKARSLLWPIKQKHGLGLSWGDLFILAGTTAIKHMGGPILGFCGGRIDDQDGFWSQELGPTTEQEALFPCDSVNGNCSKESGLGSTTVGLIYLNPEGPLGKPIPELSAPQIRDSFGRMNMNDSETVALIGGGHAFGKTHGACPKGPGKSPKEDPSNPWPGLCGDGKGTNAYTSGFEGPWTTNPTKWDNEYFQLLWEFRDEWTVKIGQGGKHQWYVPKNNPVAPSADPKSNSTQDTMMMTSDVSLLHDDSYRSFVEAWAKDSASFDDAFAHAWYKLTSRDMGPVTRCIGPSVPSAQTWQNPLPPTPSKLANFDDVKRNLRKVIEKDVKDIGAILVRLAWSCSSTYRQTDFLGGCNGARIRHSPEKDFPSNKGLDRALKMIEPMIESYSGLSWSDLIVLAGQVSIEIASKDKIKMSFCGGRTDAQVGVKSSSFLEPIVTGDFDQDSALLLKEYGTRMGLSYRELVALIGGGHSIGGFHSDVSGYQDGASWTNDPSVISNEYFSNLLNLDWDVVTVKESGKKQYRSGDLYMLKTDLILRFDDELQVYAQEFAQSNEAFMAAFANAWNKIVTADRFDGPTGNVCA